VTHVKSTIDLSYLQENGVINVALLGIIRRWHIRDQIPLREIARRLGISRNTVRRYLRLEAIFLCVCQGYAKLQ
jgi:DNA-binding IclR family transcriptional regulator